MSNPETTADWPVREPAACLYECTTCGTTEVWPWGDRWCPECEARGNPPRLMVFRRYATENDCVTSQTEHDKTTAFVIYNPRGMEIAVCLNRATAEAIIDRTYGCYLRELPIAEDVSALERFRR